ncbi:MULTISPECIES: gas vesicle protein GvpG [Prosthecochloris]|uniref:Gas vesicle protein GvpG n=1 Tax=Prosthecochloris marina TaxID=2017681 RepID=A0A317T7W3_9CHLB|nr:MULTISPECIES: gas vesicle protein GvpG [Prosthecochloris]PWW82400.1 gas vesicle protein GvpG [Prosthecochloris marina]UZJ37383.1 gas vesicle protein GvpG [Prosthecochloris sp. SCSIO W1103]UZJ39205.1 gas vesicle protein GvpG [Prosthecochloris sp. SCSIO W1102]UZJ41177.1 gas vesicle protein GvpG [Prosthecochloris sp. SCSIO W1101]
MLLVDDIFFAPINSIIWIAKKIDDISQKELSDKDKVKEKLMELQLRYELDEIGEEEYYEKEKELLEYLKKETE